ncbi:hypothetical protein DLM86_01075 [Paenibacillus flagellatus]|uniref:Uncharacterized protein n=1 Tax=Paenibacillus flagellatus TaxID=2211139 RepID=A0A2V5KBX0_9BACL|nr:hypothetical protein DLM86_01075 [Paenibacillus flagellatus]
MPSLELIGRWLSGIGLFAAGMVVGAAVYMSVHQANFSLLVERNTVLVDENDNLKKELQNLNKFKNSQSVIKKITVRVENGTSSPTPAIDPIAEQELKQQVQKVLEPVYVGHSLTLFTSGAEDQRTAEILKLRKIVSQPYTVKEHTYKAEFSSMAIVQTELIVYIKASASAVDSFSFH